MLIALQNFRGERPVANARLLAANEAQAARNVKLWSGKLKPWFSPRVEQVTGISDTHAIYHYKDRYWLSWPTDVDVVRGPIAGTDRIYWTGDGPPKFGNGDVIVGETVLTAAAITGELSIVVENARSFDVGETLEIQLNSGTHETTVDSVNLTSNTIVLIDALTGPASIGKAVRNRDIDYPHGSYLLGVPAPVSAPASATQANAGTVSSIGNILGVASNTDQTELDLEITSDGGAIEFQVSALVSGQVFGVQSKETTISVIRDPDGDAEVVFEQTDTKTVQGAQAGQYSYFPDAANFRWRPPINFRSRGGNVQSNYTFSFGADPGTETYRVTIVDGFVPAIIGGVPTTKSYELSLSARYAGRLELNILPTTHGLKEGDKIQFAGIMGSENLTDLNKDVVSVISVDGSTIAVDSNAFGILSSSGTWEQVWDAEDLATRNYVYTYVATLDGKEMEGPPSPASEQLNVGDNQPVLVSGIAQPTDLLSRPYSAVRIYRVAVGTTDEEYLFVAEIPLGTTSYTDEVRGTELGEVLPSLLWDPPPDDLSGIIELPGGVLAAIRKNNNEVLFSEPYQPHAWPDSYKRALPEKTVSIGAFGSSIIVSTKGKPTLMTGIAPTDLSEDQLETVHPCLAKRGTVDMGYAILYPSNTGLVMTGVGIADVVTADLFSADEWNALNPSSFVAARYDDRYICFYDNGDEKAGFIIDPRNPGSTLTFLDLWALDAWSDPESGELFLALPAEDGTEEIVAWNGDKNLVPQLFRWRSKEFVSNTPVSMGVVKVDADQYPVKVNLFMDGTLFDTMDVNSEAPVRCIDELGKGRLWEVEIIGNTDVDAVYVAPNMRSLTRYMSGAA